MFIILCRAKKKKIKKQKTKQQPQDVKTQEMFKCLWSFRCIGTRVYFNTHMWNKAENPFITLHNPSSVQIRGRMIITKDEKRYSETAPLRNVLGYLNTLNSPRWNQVHIENFFKWKLHMKCFFSPSQLFKEEQNTDLFKTNNVGIKN